MSITVMPQSVKIYLARGSAATDGAGTADVVIKVPGTVGNKERTIEGGFGCFQNQEPGDYLQIDLRDDDNLLGYGAGFVLDTFNDPGTPAANSGWYFLGSSILNLHPIVSNDPTELPSGMYLHVIGQKANIATSDTLYINLHWGERLR